MLRASATPSRGLRRRRTAGGTGPAPGCPRRARWPPGCTPSPPCRPPGSRCRGEAPGVDGARARGAHGREVARGAGPDGEGGGPGRLGAGVPPGSAVGEAGGVSSPRSVSRRGATAEPPLGAASAGRAAGRCGGGGAADRVAVRVAVQVQRPAGRSGPQEVPLAALRHPGGGEVADAVLAADEEGRRGGGVRAVDAGEVQHRAGPAASGPGVGPAGLRVADDAQPVVQQHHGGSVHGRPRRAAVRGRPRGRTGCRGWRRP